jgi:outer membrane protein assembly factor BamB
MNIKIECVCGTKYSFDVEPVNGRMPFTVQCPKCQADGTGAANELLAQAAVPVAPPAARLRVQVAAVVPASEAPALEPPLAPRLDLAAFKAEKKNAEERAFRKGARLLAGGAILVVLCLGAWAWYTFIGTQPHLAGSLVLPSGAAARVKFLGPDKIIIVTPTDASLRDLSLAKTFWTTPLASPMGRAPLFFPDKDKLWICLWNQVQCLDTATGAVKHSIPIAGQLSSFTLAESNILAVSELDETRRVVLHIDRATGGTASQEISVPRREVQTTPNDLPSNVLPTAAVLTAQVLDGKFSKTLDAMSSEFFSTGKNLLEMRVKLLTPNVTYIQSIKPRGPSQLNGQTTASTSPGLVAEEVFNDIKRSQTGGVRAVDESKYEVRLRRWLEQEPVEWHGDVMGPPVFFPLTTVDLLVAGQTLMVFDKQNTRLFESKLSYPISERFTGGRSSGGLAPAAEGSNTLYFFDEGVLTAFSLPSGEVRWRLPSFGISAIHGDDKGMLYVDSTTGGPEDVKYADTISLEKIPPVLLKVDAASGKILWKAESRGDRSFVSGKFVYSESVEQGGVALAEALGDALDQPRGEGAVYFYLYRLDPATGEAVWSLSREASPRDVVIERNRILLRFGDELQVFKFLAF